MGSRWAVKENSLSSKPTLVLLRRKPERAAQVYRACALSQHLRRHLHGDLRWRCGKYQVQFVLRDGSWCPGKAWKRLWLPAVARGGEPVCCGVIGLAVA